MSCEGLCLLRASFLVSEISESAWAQSVALQYRQHRLLSYLDSSYPAYRWFPFTWVWIPIQSSWDNVIQKSLVTLYAGTYSGQSAQKEAMGQAGTLSHLTVVLGGKDPELPEVLLASLPPDLHLAWLFLPLLI